MRCAEISMISVELFHVVSPPPPPMYLSLDCKGLQIDNLLAPKALAVSCVTFATAAPKTTDGTLASRATLRNGQWQQGTNVAYLSLPIPPRKG